MQEKNLNQKQMDIASKDVEIQTDQLSLKPAKNKSGYSKPRMVSYGSLSKNINFGLLSGAETDSTFAV